MKNSGLFLGILLAFSQAAAAQSEEENVKKTIDQLFDGMRNADSAMVSRTFAEDARLLTVVEQEGKVRLQEEPVRQFLAAVGTPRKEVWDERVVDYQIRIDGPLATAWTPYRFYVDTTFSHCGVNAFQLYQSGQEWKIIQITDTRRREGCEE